MFQRCNVIKKMSVVLMSVLVCGTSTMSGYADERLENTGFDEARGVVTFQDDASYEENDFDGNERMVVMSRVATSTDATPSDATLKDEDGYIISGKWECENGIIVELADNVLIIDGKGKIESDVKDIIGKTICKSNKYKVKCIICDGITEFCDNLFEACGGLESIEIPNSVMSIGEYAFCGCSRLSSIEIPNNVTSIGYSTFSGCSRLSSIEIPNSVTSIGRSAFSDCSNLSSIEIPNSVTSIGESVFYGCSRLSSIKIPNSVTIIYKDTFSNCSRLSSIEIPNSVTIISGGTFYGCSSLNNIKVAQDNPIYDSRENCNAIIETKTNQLIQGCNNTKIPNSVTSIGESAFGGYSRLSSIEIPNSVTSIGKNAFRDCSNLGSIEIPNSVTSIGEYAFCGCSRLSSIEIPSSVTSIEKGVFSSCGKLSSIEIPNSVTSIGYGAFSSCSSLNSIKVAQDNPIYDSRENCNAIIETKTNQLIRGCNNTKISNSVTSIGERAFSGCSRLSSIEIPNSVTSIGGYAFYGCSSLSSIEIPNSVTSIGYGAFSSCSSLNSIKVAQDNPIYDSRENCNAIIETKTNQLIQGCNNTKISNSVTSIGGGAFSGCSSLSGIEIPSSVTSIGYSAFSACSSLTKITNNSSTSLSLASFIHSDENGQWYLENTDTIITSISDGQTAIYKAELVIQYGDIGGDGEINVQDAVLLKKHLASVKGMDINEQACDVNADGTVNVQDAVILLKYLAGMKITLGK